jgi:hypothetical protein
MAPVPVPLGSQYTYRVLKQLLGVGIFGDFGEVGILGKLGF